MSSLGKLVTYYESVFGLFSHKEFDAIFFVPDATKRTFFIEDPKFMELIDMIIQYHIRNEAPIAHVPMMAIPRKLFQEHLKTTDEEAIFRAAQCVEQIVYCMTKCFLPQMNEAYEALKQDSGEFYSRFVPPSMDTILFIKSRLALLTFLLFFKTDVIPQSSKELISDLEMLLNIDKTNLISIQEYCELGSNEYPLQSQCADSAVKCPKIEVCNKKDPQLPKTVPSELKTKGLIKLAEKKGNGLVALIVLLKKLSPNYIARRTRMCKPSTQGKPELHVGELLAQCEQLVSPDKQYTLQVQPDGDLVITDASKKRIWTSGTGQQEANGFYKLLLLQDRLALLNPHYDTVWQVGPFDSEQYIKLRLQNDGALEVVGRSPSEVSAGWSPLWSSRG